MDMARTRSIPEPWYSAMVKAGFTGVADEPVINRLSAESGLAQTTIANIIDGKTRPKAPAIIALAGALGRTPQTVAGWCGQAWGRPTPNRTLPADVSKLTRREWKAALELIACFAEARSDPMELRPTPRTVKGQRPGNS